MTRFGNNIFLAMEAGVCYAKHMCLYDSVKQKVVFASECKVVASNYDSFLGQIFVTLSMPHPGSLYNYDSLGICDANGQLYLLEKRSALFLEGLTEAELTLTLSDVEFVGGADNKLAKVFLGQEAYNKSLEIGACDDSVKFRANGATRVASVISSPLSEWKVSGTVTLGANSCLALWYDGKCCAKYYLSGDNCVMTLAISHNSLDLSELKTVTEIIGGDGAMLANYPLSVEAREYRSGYKFSGRLIVSNSCKCFAVISGEKAYIFLGDTLIREIAVGAKPRILDDGSIWWEEVGKICGYNPIYDSYYVGEYAFDKFCVIEKDYYSYYVYMICGDRLAQGVISAGGLSAVTKGAGANRVALGSAKRDKMYFVGLENSISEILPNRFYGDYSVIVDNCLKQTGAKSIDIIGSFLDVDFGGDKSLVSAIDGALLSKNYVVKGRYFADNDTIKYLNHYTASVQNICAKPAGDWVMLSDRLVYFDGEELCYRYAESVQKLSQDDFISSGKNSVRGTKIVSGNVNKSIKLSVL